MKGKLVSSLPDRDMQGAPAALLRAAKRAREIARETSTGVVYLENGKLVEERLTRTRAAPRTPSARPANGTRGRSR